MTPHNYLTLSTELDKSVSRTQKFYLHKLEGEESISQDFRYTLTVSAKERLSEKEMDQLTGSSITIGIQFTDSKLKNSERFINGIVYKISEKNVSQMFHKNLIWKYEIEIGSWFRKLEHIKDCRIVQKTGNRSTTIVKELLGEYGLNEIRFDVQENLPRKDTLTIYNETIGNFIKRVLFEDGLIWWFEHDDKKHVLVVSDDSRKAVTPAADSFAFHESVTSFCRIENHYTIKEVSHGSYSNERFSNASVDQRTGAPKDATFNSYEYTGRFNNDDEGQIQIANRNRITESESHQFQGESNIRTLKIGENMALKTDLLPDLSDKKYFVYTLAIDATDKEYKNQFHCLPSNVKFLPNIQDDLIIPSIPGPQTAYVIGQGSKASLSADNLGRVRVQFHWNRHRASESNQQSAWVRVAMPFAGGDRGSLFNPREGEEVVVAFENSNPDRPYIIGSVYSGINPPPFQPASNAYKSIIKSDADSDSNQVMFYDKPGSESLEIIANKEMTIKVNNKMVVDVVKNAKIESTSSRITAKTGVDIKAGNEINNMSLATILGLAMNTVTNTAGRNILNCAAGIVAKFAGGVISNLAGGLYANASLLGVREKAKSELKNESKNIFMNIASNVLNSGEDKVEDKAALAILNSVSKDHVNKGKKMEDKADLVSMTKSTKTMVTAKTTVGP